MSCTQLLESRTNPSSFVPYHLNNGVVVQFLLQELIQTFQIGQQFDLRDENLSESAAYEIFITVSKVIGQVCLSYNPLSPQSHGSLTRLKDYAEQLSYNERHNKHYQTLYTTIHQAWLSMIQHCEKLRFLSVHQQTPSPKFITQLKQATDQFKRYLDQITSMIPRIIANFWENENTILYLLEQQEWIYQIFGHDALYNVFECPMDKTELTHYLQNKYNSRGFENLQSRILELINSIHPKND